MYILCGLVGGITLAAITIYLVRRRNRLHDKLTGWMTSGQQQLPSEQYKVCPTFTQCPLYSSLLTAFTHWTIYNASMMALC